jgi:vacuolar-type H+-ATPase subunit I/STV1
MRKQSKLEYPTNSKRKIEKLNQQLNETNFKIKETKMNFQDSIDVLNKTIDDYIKENEKLSEMIIKSKEKYVKS